MDGDAFLYVRDDNVCLCSTTIRDGAVTYYLQELLRKAALRKDATMFDLVKVADIDKVKMLKAQGVKEIKIRSTLFEASARYHQRKGQTLSIAGAAAKQLKAVLGKEHDVTNDALQVAIMVKTDERRKGMKLGEERIQALTPDLLNYQEEGDDFLIVTNLGQRIVPKEIYMKSIVTMKASGQIGRTRSRLEGTGNFFCSAPSYRCDRAITCALSSFFVCFCGALVGAYFGQPYVRDNADAVLIIITVLTVFAGFLVAIITILGDPSDDPRGQLAGGGIRRDNTEARLITHKWLFLVYLIAIGLLFQRRLACSSRPYPRRSRHGLKGCI